MTVKSSVGMTVRVVGMTVRSSVEMTIRVVEKRDQAMTWSLIYYKVSRICQIW